MRACMKLIPALLLSCAAVCAMAETPEDKPDSKVSDTVLSTLPGVVAGTPSEDKTPADKESPSTHDGKETSQGGGALTGIEQAYSPEAVKEMAETQRDAMREQIKGMSPEEKEAFRKSLLGHMSKADRAQYDKSIDAMSMKKYDAPGGPPAQQ